MNDVFYIYIISCSGGRLYTGYTSDPVKRFKEHKTGKRGAKFTRGFTPVSFEGLWEVNGSRGDAMKIEAFIKSLKRVDKTALIDNPESLRDLLPEPVSSIDVKVSCLTVVTDF
ncbi:MAG TPA: GIY-YIG nuclease family protein [Spirochaetota bacterium]|nr:GIY-YIG nuclease family protein [Spirochaetota bacterium]HPJ33753.1 GIY-YIG nuclease family protein [Spirochaetota bacterium]